MKYEDWIALILLLIMVSACAWIIGLQMLCEVENGKWLYMECVK